MIIHIIVYQCVYKPKLTIRNTSTSHNPDAMYEVVNERPGHGAGAVLEMRENEAYSVNKRLEMKENEAYMVWLSQEAPLTLKAVHDNIVPVRIYYSCIIIYNNIILIILFCFKRYMHVCIIILQLRIC